MTTDLAQYTYGDLVAALRKDLLLDATTDVLPGTILASLLDQNGKAAFLQLLTAAKLRLAFGQTTCLGGVSVTVPHGLGVVPIIFGGIAGRSGAGIVPAIVDANQDPTSTNLILAVTQTTGSGNTYKLWWFAIG